ncbi:MAG: hypothetical protein ACK5LL_15650 [Suipraeoptans sp.]
MKIRDRIIHAGILVVVFIAAIIFFSNITNKGNDDMTADMDEATLPQISFMTKEYGVNALSGYTGEMNLTSMRGTITPVYNQKLNITIQEYDAKISELNYTIYTLDGGTELESGSIKNPGDREEIDLSKEGILDAERIIKISMDIGSDSPISYFTRIANGDTNYAEQCLNFAHEFHEEAIEKSEESDITDYIEPDITVDNNNYSSVSIRNNLDAVTWGDLSPKVTDKIRYSYMELRANYSTIKLEYKVLAKENGEDEDTYKVTEVFKIRYNSENNKYYLLDYNRTMDKMLNTSGTLLSSKGLNLGIVSKDTKYLVNGDGNGVSFVQAGEVWSYNKVDDELAKVFSFQDAGVDERNLRNDYSITLLSIDDNGNTTFGVYGYMNRGNHEGQNGVAIYYYDTSKSSVDEKIFIESKHSYEEIAIEMGQLIYYSTSEDVFYVMIDGTLHEITSEESSKDEKVIVSDLHKDQYAISDSGNKIAYGSKIENDKITEITVLNLESGKKQEIESEEGESVKPLGFVADDFVYGTIKEGSVGNTTLGEQVEAMSEIIIKDNSAKTIKTYKEENIYITSAIIEDNMITLKRATKESDVYNEIADDYIVNNEEKDASNIYLEAYSDKASGTMMRLTFANGISDKDAKILTPKMVLYESPLTISFEEDTKNNRFYVYGQGKLQGIYERAGEAVIAAEAVAGTVVDSTQTYIWERGNRRLQYSVTEQEDLIASVRDAMLKGETPITAINNLKEYYALNLTGISTEQGVYLINSNTPIISVMNDGRQLILTGYDTTGVGYIDVHSGEVNSISYESMDASVIAFIGMAPLF